MDFPGDWLFWSITDSYAEREMRPLTAIAALLLISGLTPTAGFADGMPPARPAAKAALPSCPCPPVRHVRHIRYRHHYVRHWRAPLVPVVAVAPLLYNAPIPWPWDTAYDRGMVLHFRSAAVSGTWTGVPGFPHTPPIVPVEWYREPTADAAVLQYDGLTGQYIRLAAADRLRAYPAPGAPPPPR
jgi:hypothetical protein